MQFTTVYPGWYSGRTVHIHVRVRTYSGTTQLDEFTAHFFDDTVTDTVFAQSPYSTRAGGRDTRNARKMVLTGSSGGAGSATIGANLKAAAASKPVITSGGVVNAASYAARISPGSWVTIFGQNLASATQALVSSDVAGGKLPAALGGVSVTIDGQSAYVLYVSATQINVQAPAATNTGKVQVTVTNASGSSDTVTVDLQSIAPGLFASGGKVAAVRADGTVIDGTTVFAKPGDILEIYGTGFGPTTPTVEPGLVYAGSAPVTGSVTMTVGTSAAFVSYSGLVGAGLFATIAGLSTQTGVVLAVKAELPARRAETTRTSLGSA